MSFFYKIDNSNLQKSTFMGQIGHANPHISLPLMSQQSGKFIHHNNGACSHALLNCNKKATVINNKIVLLVMFILLSDDHN